MEWIFVGAIGGGLLAWYLYRRFQDETPEDTEPQTNETEEVDEYEDLLLTGLLLDEIYDDDQDSSDDADADRYDDGFNGGYDDGGTLE